MPKANTVDEILASFHVPAEKEAARITVELLRANALLREGRDGSDGLLDMQRHRDAWRRYAYGRGPRPRDFLDGNMVAEDRGSTAVLEAGQRERIAAYLREYPRPKNRTDFERGCIEADALLRELAGAGEPVPVVDENCVACTKPDVFAVHLCKGRRLGPPAPPASAPRRMVGRHKGNVSYTHAETVDCEARCLPVEPPKVRRMRANPDPDACGYHEREHDEIRMCLDFVYPPCHPVASAPKRRMVNSGDGEHDEDPQCAGIGCQPVAPSSTEAAGPSPECHHAWIAVDGGSRCVKCKDTRASRVAPTQPPHVHQWGKLEWNSWNTDDANGRPVLHTRVTREHCVADGCSSPPAMREVQHV